MNNKTMKKTGIQEDHYYTNTSYRVIDELQELNYPLSSYDKREDMHVVLKLNINEC